MTVQEYFHSKPVVLPIRVGDTVKAPYGGEEEQRLITWDVLNNCLLSFDATPGSRIQGMSQHRRTPERNVSIGEQYVLSPKEIEGLRLKDWTRTDAPSTSGPTVLPLGSRLNEPICNEEFILAAHRNGYVMVRLADGCYWGDAKRSYPQVCEAACRELSIMDWEIKSLRT